MKIQGKQILITGANRGIGLAFAKVCAAHGAHLILAVRQTSPDLIQDLKSAGASSVQVIVTDLSSFEGVEQLAKKMRLLPIDILFNNAGQLTGGLLETQPLDEIYKMFQVNVNALVHLTRAVIPEMVRRGSGKIINHASVSAVMHFPCASTYAASKAAVWAFTDCIQQELKGTGVSTLCLFTPGVKTRMFDEIDVLYSKNIDVVNESISPELYADLILKAVQNNNLYLEPTGTTGVGFRVAQHFKGIFNWGVSQKFKR